MSPQNNRSITITTYSKVAQISAHNNLSTDIKSNCYPNHYHNSTTEQHRIVNIKINKVKCPTYPDKFMGDMLLHRLFDFRLAVTQPSKQQQQYSV